MLPAFHNLFRLLLERSVPTFAAVRGQCLGGGLELAAFCSWIIASPRSMFGQPEIKLAVFPPMASVLLPWRLGGARGLDLCVSGRSVNAEEAVADGARPLHRDGPPVAASVAFVRSTSPGRPPRCGSPSGRRGSASPASARRCPPWSASI
jgi:cyclohexa-1,5-dienecarbonyl-CoA hydratase